MIDYVVIDKGREAPNRKMYLMEFGIPYRLKQLEVGDYLLGEDYNIEYKSWMDLYSSKIDGRLWEQLKNMQQYKHPLIAVVGNKYKSLMKLACYRRMKKKPEEEIRSALATIYKSFNVSIMFFDNDKDFCEFVATLFRQLNKEKRHYRPVFHKRRPKSLKEIQENVLCEVPKISVGKSKMILEPNDYSLLKVINNPDALESIKGISTNVIDEIKKVFK